MKKILLSTTIALTSLIYQNANAQTLTDQLPPELQSEINNSISQAVNGLVIFSSSSSLGSGYFTFDAKDSPDTKLDIIRLMGDYKLGNPEDSIVPFVRGGVGQLKLSEEIPDFLEQGGANDFSTVTTSSVSLGAGADVNITGGFYFTPMFDLIYSHTENKYDYNNIFSQEILKLFDRDVFNWDIDTMSYNPGAMIKYVAKSGSTTITPSVTYTHAFVNSFWTNSSLYDVNTSSGILNSKIKAEIPSGFNIGSSEISVIPQFSRTDIYKDARAGIGIGYFHEVAVALMAKNQTFLPLFQDIGVSGGYSFGDDVTGYRIGIEAEL